MSPAIHITRWRFPANLAAALLLALPAVAAAAHEIDTGRECPSSSDVTQLDAETASAGVVSNALNRAGSIRAASHRLLTSALDSARSREPMQWVLFTSTPELSENSEDENGMCARLEQATGEDPIMFEDRNFESADELTSWIMDFTQGKGGDGKSLYEQCPGKCSPRYTWWIEPAKSGLKVDASVVCGLPRDRNGNKYHLATGLARAC
jgi:hypothetical protein